jgi:membrane protease subunit (stomatin/prohibitin family)
MVRATVGTAIVAGTAGAVHHHQDKKWAAQDAAAAAEQQAAMPQAAPAQDDLTAQLEQLNDLKNKGILTEEEFQAKKKQLLGI